MELLTIAIIVAVVVAGILMVNVLKKMVSLALSIAGIFLVVWLVIVGLRYLDENNVRDNILDSNVLYLLQDQGDTITGFATQGNAMYENISTKDLVNPNSFLYDDYYKVVVVRIDTLPDDLGIIVEAAESDDKEMLFRHYVDNELLEGDPVQNLIDMESNGSVDVYKETIAFKHGLELIR